MNQVMNKPPRISPILSNNNFIINCKDNATVFANFFSLQCKPMFNNSVLPNLTYVTNSRLVDIVISLDEIISLIRNLNKGKATGPDEISAQMLIMCDDSIATPLRIIYENILSSGIYPNIWKSANLSPIHKNGMW